MADTLNKDQELQVASEELEKAWDEAFGEPLNKSEDEGVLSFNSLFDDELSKAKGDVYGKESKYDNDDKDDDYEDEEEDEEDDDMDKAEILAGEFADMETEEMAKALLIELDNMTETFQKSQNKRFNRQIKDLKSGFKNVFSSLVKKVNVLEKAVEEIGRQPSARRGSYEFLTKAIGYTKEGDKKEYDLNIAKEALSKAIDEKKVTSRQVESIEKKFNRGVTLTKSEIEILGLEV